MPKFRTIDEETATSKPAMDQLPPTTKGALDDAALSRTDLDKSITLLEKSLK